MPTIKPDAIVTLGVYAKELGGHPIHFSPKWQCRFPLQIDNESFDCALLFEGEGSILPGQRTRVSIKFLYPERAKQHIKVGSKFRLWDRRDFAEGEILEVLT